MILNDSDSSGRIGVLQSKVEQLADALAFTMTHVQRPVPSVIAGAAPQMVTSPMSIKRSRRCRGSESKRRAAVFV